MAWDNPSLVLRQPAPPLLPLTDPVQVSHRGTYTTTPADLENFSTQQATVVVAGTFHAGDVLNVTVAGIATAYTVVSGDTNNAGAAASLAAALTTALGNLVSVSVNSTTITLQSQATSGRTNFTISSSVTGGGATMTLATPVSGKFAPVAATGTLTVAGTFHAGDILSLTIQGVNLTYTVVAGDTNNAGAAASLNNLIKLVPEWLGVFTTSIASNIITFTALNPGQGGNTIGLTTSVSGASATMTLNSSAAQITTYLTGGVGSVTPLQSAVLQVGRSTVNIYAGRPITNPTSDLITALQNSSIYCI